MSQEIDPSRYHSNDWLIPIADEAKDSVFSQFPQKETAIEVAAAVLRHVDGGETEIPWTTVFPSDDRNQVGARLLQVMQTPDKQTPAHNPNTSWAVDELRTLLSRHNATGMLGCHAAYHLVQTAAGKADENFSTYQDLGRQWPQHAFDWVTQLVRQFGSEGYEEIQDTHSELAVLLGETALVAQDHYQQKGKIPQSGETAFDVINRVGHMVDLSSLEGLKETNRILGQGFEGYQSAAYQLRGLPEPTPST